MKKTITAIMLATTLSINAQEMTTKTIQMDNTSIEWIKDKPGETKQTKSVFNNTPDSILTSLGLEDGIPSSISCFLLKSGDKEILFDAGLGMESSLLLKTLANQGKKPEDIKFIFITHLHGDHIGGMVKDGKKVFPNAEVYLNKTEYDAWMAMPEDKNKQQRDILDKYKSQLRLFNIGDKLPADVKAIEAYGHTPGHTVFLKDKILIIGDLMHGAELQMRYPEYCPFFDMDKEKAIESRKRILTYAKEGGLLMAGMHLPDPGFIDMK